MAQVEQLIIMGSGPAGLTAAVYAARAELNPLLFEGFAAGGQPGGQLMTTTEVENFPGFATGITGPELIQNMRAQAERFGTRFIMDDIVSVEVTWGPGEVAFAPNSHALFNLRSASGAVYVAKSLIIATGASARYLGLESEQRLLNRGVSGCATCDGALPIFRGQELVVVGGGDSAIEEASFLTRFAKQVYIVHRRTELRASKIMQARALANPKITLLTPFKVLEILGKEAVEGIRLENLATHEVLDKPVAGVFLGIGHEPNTAVFKGLLELDEQGYIRTRGRSTYTSIPGIFACGDVQDHVYRQAISAAGSGCQAAIDAERWLAEQGS